MKASIKTATRFSFATAIAATFLAIALPAQADPKSTASPSQIKSKQAPLDLQKQKIVAMKEEMKQKKQGNRSQKQTVDKNSSKESTVTASPSATPPKTKKSLSKDN